MNSKTTWAHAQPDISGLGGRIFMLRHRLGLTQAQAEARAGMPARNWDHYEKGRREPKAGTLARIALALGTTTDHLVGLR